MELYHSGVPYLTLALYLFAFLLGCVVASFVNVLIHRLPRGMDFVRGRSACPACGETLRPRDLVPVLSWLALRGRCRYCGAPISARYAAVELLGGGLAALCLMVYGPSLVALAAFAMLVGLVAVAFIDLDTLEIPGGLLLYLLLPAAALVALLPGVSLLSHGVGALVVAGPLLLFALVIPGAFGGGDVKLMAVCGLALGGQLTLLAGFVAIVFGGLYGIILLVLKKATRKQHFAFGPFLSAGVALALLFGRPLLNWYLGFF